MGKAVLRREILALGEEFMVRLGKGRWAEGIIIGRMYNAFLDFPLSSKLN
jgi:hypothetical protein